MSNYLDYAAEIAQTVPMTSDEDELSKEHASWKERSTRLACIAQCRIASSQIYLANKTCTTCLDEDRLLIAAREIARFVEMEEARSQKAERKPEAVRKTASWSERYRVNDSCRL